MNKIPSFIYYDICERSLMSFESSNYLTYRAFCLNIKTCIQLKKVSTAETRYIMGIQEYLSNIYGLSFAEATEYIYDYFIEEKWVLFEEAVKLMKIYFRNSVIWVFILYNKQLN